MLRDFLGFLRWWWWGTVKGGDPIIIGVVPVYEEVVELLFRNEAITICVNFSNILIKQILITRLQYFLLHSKLQECLQLYRIKLSSPITVKLLKCFINKFHQLWLINYCIIRFLFVVNNWLCNFCTRNGHCIVLWKVLRMFINAYIKSYGNFGIVVMSIIRIQVI